MLKEYDKQVFADNLNRHMDASKINSTDVCALLSVSKATVSDWRNAKKMPRMDKIERLASYFGIKMSDLIEKPATTNDGLSAKDVELIEMLKQLSPAESQRVRDFVAGIVSNR